MPSFNSLAGTGALSAIILLSVGAGALARSAPARTPGGSVTDGAPVVTITARDYAFEAPDTVAAGLTTLRLVNRGPELHHVQLLRLEDGKTMADLHAAFTAGGPPPRWVRDMGGPNTPVPGAESQAALELAPGRYVISCFIPSGDGVPHIAKGMMRELIVKANHDAALRPAGNDAAAPTATMTLTDYDFSLSVPLAVGRQTVRVRNAASQSHEVVLVRLAPGKAPADVVAWVEKPNGPPPGAPIGGTTGMASGTWNDITVNLEAGEYALICFIPDSKDGKPHFMHGMMKQIRVGTPASPAAGGSASAPASTAHGAAHASPMQH
jgi:hypothetical protein